MAITLKKSFTFLPLRGECAIYSPTGDMAIGDISRMPRVPFNDREVMTPVGLSNNGVDFNTCDGLGRDPCLLEYRRNIPPRFTPNMALLRVAQKYLSEVPIFLHQRNFFASSAIRWPLRW